MIKVVRAFSLDEAVSDDLNIHTQVPGKSKPMNKSKYVNEALKFYMGKNISALIQENKDYKAYLGTATNNLADARATIGGLEADLAKSLAVRESPNCRCLWCRLLRLLRKRE